ncbi:BZIP transcription factor [Purpureocillium lavendulum]|uniref:BZIP transcription factor n=1 Tax=Purpureocillium lavendulum TaxID=1247861 RepID=A0AB34FLE1_9HYPO|nr:BZIP transcription factor [Purpureocillium lavendulum]
MGGRSPGDRDEGGAERAQTGDEQSPLAAAIAVGAGVSPIGAFMSGVKRRDTGSVPRDDGAAASEAAGSSADGADDAGRRKKVKAGAGGRGVANLTPEQLAKKRANDREAQRAIRERTKNQIETLERRIRELTSLKPYQELQAVVHAKEAVERENSDIKRQLATIVGLLKPIIGTDVPGVSPAPAYAPPPTSHGWAHGEASAAGTPGELSTAHLQQQRHRIRHDLEMGPERLELGFLLHQGQGQHLHRLQGGVHGAQDTAQYQHVPMKHDWTAVTKNAALSSRQSPLAGAGGSVTGYDGQHQGAGPASGAEHSPESLPRERRQRAAEGLPMQQVIGPRYPSVSSLLNPANSAFSHPLSKVFTDILATFPDISMLPERVAVLYVMFLVMRWQIAPTRDNYERLPEWMQPTASQLTHAHPAWIDHLPFPLMREKLARDYNPHEYLFDNFFIPFTTTLRLSWPYDETDTLLLVPDSDEVVINPVFERHLRNLDNWRLGDRFVRAFPTLADMCNIDTRTSGAPPSSSASSMTHPVGIFHLPSEILHEIFDYVKSDLSAYPARAYRMLPCSRPDDRNSRRDVKSARLTCRLFNEFAGSRLFPSLELDISQTSLDFLDRLSRQPVISKGLRDIDLYLYYHPAEAVEDLNVYVEHPMNVVTMLADRCEIDRSGRQPTEDEFRELLEAAKVYREIQAAWSAYLDAGCYDVMPQDLFQYQQFLLQCYENCRDQHQEQFRLLSQGTFVSGLVASLARIGFSGSISFGNQTFEAFGPLFRAPALILSGMGELRQIMESPWVWNDVERRWPDACRTPAAVLWELPISLYKAGTVLKGMKISAIPTNQDFRILQSSQQGPRDPMWEDLRAAVANLKTFRCTSWLAGYAEDGRERDPPENSAFLDILLSALLSSRSLRQVRIELCGLGIVTALEPEGDGDFFGNGIEIDGQTVKDYYPFGQVLGTVSWPHLVSLKLACVNLEQRDLEAFFWRPAAKHEIDLLREKFASMHASGRCRLSVGPLWGGGIEKLEHDRLGPATIDWLEQRHLSIVEWDVIVWQLVQLYVRGEEGMENPLIGDIDQMLLVVEPRLVFLSPSVSNSES